MKTYPANRRKRRPLLTLICRHCQSIFSHRSETRLFCSLACSNEARRLDPATKRQRAREAHLRWAAKNPDRIAAIRENTRLRGYGLTHDEYAAILDRQNGECPIGPHPFPASEWRPCIDHDHATGKVRGLLCRYHNTVLGQIETHAAAWRAYLGRETFR